MHRSTFSAVCLLALIACAPSQDVEKPGISWVVSPGVAGEWDSPELEAGMHVVTGTIQDAIDQAAPGDIITVQSGTFFENLVMANGVHVVGAGMGETIVAGNVTMTDFTTDTVLAALTVSNPGTIYTDVGVWISGGQGTVADVEIRYFDNGVQVTNSPFAVIERNVLWFNNYGSWADVSSLVVQNNLFQSNVKGGVTHWNTDGQVIHNTLVGNAFGASTVFEWGGSIQMDAGTSDVVANNIVVSNFFGISCRSCGANFSNNLVWGNTTNYVNEASAMGDDINVDPQFADPSNNDYRLSNISPAIDTANSAYPTALDYYREARPQGARGDVGFDEFSVSSYDLMITEVMANATVETVDEFIEVYNFGPVPVDLLNLVVTDGDDPDTLQAYAGGSTVVMPGTYGVIVDPDYAGVYGIPAGVTVVTTMDTNVGNGLTTSDQITLFEPDASTIISTFTYPSDPGDGYSREMYSLAQGDSSGNWRDSQCASGSSPGEAHCFPPTGDPMGLVLTEVMANPASQSTEEYVELFNPTTETIDAAGLVLSDGDSPDILRGFGRSSTLIGPGEHALILDPGYAYTFALPNGIALLTTGDQSLGNGLAISDPVSLLLPDAVTVIDSMSFPANYGSDVSIEKLDYAVGDVGANWDAASNFCVRSRSPGRLNGGAGGLCESLLINEVMANPLVEDTGEFVELLNLGFDTIDLAGLLVSDGPNTDTIASYQGGSTLLAPLQFAVLVDSEFAGDYAIPAGALVVTTTDTHIGNGISVSDTITIWEGSFLIDSYHYPFNPGNGLSAERVWEVATDARENWIASPCPSGSSPGADNCATGGVFGGSGTSAVELVISEVMANALDEGTGEFVEIYNYGAVDVDLSLYTLWDGDAIDIITGWGIGASAVVPAGGYAVILDADYAGEYTLPPAAIWLTTGDTTLGSGLSTADEVFLFEPDGLTLIDSFTSPSNPGNGISIEKIDLLGGDIGSNWRDSTCVSGSSPGDAVCP